MLISNLQEYTRWMDGQMNKDAKGVKVESNLSLFVVFTDEITRETVSVYVGNNEKEAKQLMMDHFSKNPRKGSPYIDLYPENTN